MTPIQNLYALTPMQHGMLFHTLFVPKSGEYVEQLTCVLAGELEPERLHQAACQVLERHDILRTAFVWEDVDQPLQVVLEQVDLPFLYEDWSDRTSQDQENDFAAFLDRDRRRGFNLTHAPNLRLALFRCGTHWRLVWSYHHMVLDGWSVALVLSELLVHLHALMRGTRAQLLPVRPFSEFVDWLDSHSPADAERFWRGRLQGFAEPTSLAPSRPREKSLQPRPAWHRRALSVAATEQLGAFAARCGLTLATLVQGAWGLLLARHSDRRDVVFGVTVSGRPPALPGSLEMVGLFINTLPLRLDVQPSARVDTWLRDVQTRQAQAEPFAFVPLVEIQTWSELEDDQRLFDSLIVFENYPRAPVPADGDSRLEISQVESFAGGLPYPLSLVIRPGEQLDFELRFDQERFTSDEARQVLHQLLASIQGLASDEHATLGALAELDATARHALLIEWNDTQSTNPHPTTVDALVRSQAAQRPHRVALTYGQAHLSFGELVDRATHLAAALGDRGVGPESPVVTLMDRSPELIIAFLGVLQAGGFYVPFDPSFPLARLESMLEEVRPVALLTTGQRLAEHALLQPAEPARLCLEVDAPPSSTSTWAGSESGNSDRLAYVLFTSGSTGQPKGVGISHRAILRLVCSGGLAQVSATDRVVQTAHVAFDAATFEIWGPLTNGARLLGFGQEITLDPEAFGRELIERRASTVFLTTALFNTIARLTPEALGTLSRLYFGGEAVDAESVRQLLAAAPPERLFHVYGPTECTTFSHGFEVRSVASGADTVPIGRPIANTLAGVLDRALNPVPLLAPGELCLGGPGLARGYFGRPAWTAERFVPDPFRIGQRLYRTGDRVRSRTDGTIEFLGRFDTQVKIRGFRIEIGEIEAVAESHPRIKTCAVVVSETSTSGGQDDRSLAAWFTADGEAVDANDLQHFLAARLPRFMVPATVHSLDRLPLTRSGKVDRRALAAIPSASPVAQTTPSRPMNAIETLVASLMGEVLDCGPPRADQDFFELGGHSLSATRLISRLRQATSLEIPLRAIFDQPTVQGLASEIGRLRRGDPEALSTEPPLAPVHTPGPRPLSFAQQRLWLIDRLQPGSAAYNIASAVEIHGALSMAALATAIDDIRRRHEVLRTRFDLVDDQPIQIIDPPRREVLPLIDLGGLSAAAALQQLEALAEHEAVAPFSLSGSDMLRTQLVRSAPERFVLLITMHHIASDGWSMGIFLRELTDAYRTAIQGKPCALPDLPIQYSDFACWQRAQEETLAERVDAACERLEGLPTVLELPRDRPPSDRHRGHGRTLSFEIPSELSQAVERVAHEHAMTPFMVLLSAFFLLLSRHSGQRDLAVGTPVANRDRPDLETLIGFFVNVLVLRLETAGLDSVETLLGRVRHRTLEGFAHQDVPFEKVVERLVPDRGGAIRPLVQVMFAYNDFPTPDLDLSGVSIRPYEVSRRTASFDLTLALRPSASGFVGGVEFDSDLFDSTTAKRVIHHYRQLVDALCAQPDAHPDTLPWLSDHELHQLTVEWNDTSSALSTGTVLDAILQSCDTRPQAISVIHGDKLLSYRELARRSAHWAGHLADQGVGRDRGVDRGRIVGLHLERSLDSLIALLAIWRCGAGYLPLDPKYPLERLTFMLADSRTSVVVSRSGDLPLAELDDLEPSVEHVVAMGTDGALPTPSQALSVHLPTAQDLAYTIYTSGSTGRPKGVMIDHRSLWHHTASAAAAFSIAAEDRMLQFAPISFDTSGEEIFPTLVRGAALVLMEAITPSPTSWSTEVDQQRCTLVDLPTAFWHEVVAEWSSGFVVWPRAPRRVILGGESVLPGRLASWQARWQATGKRGATAQPQLWNTYGPTEATIVTTRALLSEIDRVALAAGRVSIGRPIHRATTFVVDALGEMAPIGAPGELCLGGAGLARGYLGRPGLTAERFRPNAWSPTRGERLYRSGDLVRRFADGQLDFLGRIDRQVKIRGFRIELGEIESALAFHPEVRDVAVLARDEGRGFKRLDAFLAPWVFLGPGEESEALQPPALREFLSETLPEFMIPSSFTVIDDLPRLPNGKLDAAALPDTTDEASGGSDYVPARNGIEEILSEVWAQILGLERVGIYDSFLDLGGHSLLATQVINRVQQIFQIEVPIGWLFERPTIAELASLLGAALQDGASESPLPPLLAVPRDRQLPLSFGQERLWFLDSMEPGSPLYNIPSVLELRGDLDLPALRRTLARWISRHEILRTSFPASEGQAIQHIHPRVRMILPCHDLGHLESQDSTTEAQRLASADASQPFDLATGPLVRTTLIRLNARDHLLLLCMHHGIFDGWSMTILIQEIAELYRADLEDRPARLPELQLHYADYAVWQRQVMASGVWARDLDYWLADLANAPVLELPTDRPRKPLHGHTGGLEPLRLDADLSRDLRALARARGASSFMVLIAIYGALLHRYSGQQDLVIGLPIANRTHMGLENLIGFFVNTLPLRLDLAQVSSLDELLLQVRSTTLKAYSHQDVPFDRVVEALNPERDPSRTPIVETLFSVQSLPRTQQLDLPGLKVRQWSLSSGTAKYDLIFAFEDTGDCLTASLEYRSTLFDRTSIRRLLAHYRTLCAQMVSQSEIDLRELPWLSPAERHQLLREWNPAPSVRQPESLSALFAARALAHADAIAVVADEWHQSYRALQQRALGLENHLRSIGLDGETPIGVYFERSPELVVSMLAIVGLGAPYVPLDPTYPTERLAWMLEDADVGGVLTLSSLADRLEALKPPRIVPLDDPDTLLETTAAETPSRDQESRKLAYLIYTSGSTGRPKGVAVEQGAIVRLVLETNYIQLGANDTVLHASNTSFDAATFEVWGALLNGSRLSVMPSSAILDLGLFHQELTRQRATTLFVTTALLNQLVDFAPEFAEPLDTLLFGGEMVDPDRVRRLLERGGPRRLLHVYGPTENTTFSTWHRVETVADSAATVPIGQPITGSTAYVVDHRGHPVPVRCLGELLLGGTGLARGYHRRPAATAQALVPDPWSPTPGARLYRTGDLVKQGPDGAIEFVGRADQQVKIRGFRIELGEIESALRNHPQVSDSAVVVLDGRLVAYLVGERGRPDPAAILAHLEKQLPKFMLPREQVLLPALPLNANGKVDRKALPRPTFTEEVPTWQAPQTEIEQLLATIWSEVLDLGQISREADFYSLGGHSLQLTQVASRVRRTFEVEMSLRHLFEDATLKAQARQIEAALDRGLAAESLIVAEDVDDTASVLSFAQQRLWFLDRLEPGSPFYNVPAAFRLVGRLDTGALEAALRCILDRHSLLRTRILERGGVPVTQLDAVDFKLPVVDLTALDRSTREPVRSILFHREARRPFDLTRQIPFRVLLLRTEVRGPQETSFLWINMHHIATDGWSLGVFARELAALYRAAVHGGTAELDPLPIQYRHFSLWQRGWLAGDTLDRLLDYWRGQLADKEPTLELPLDFPRPSVQSLRGASRPIHLDRSLSDSLSRLAIEHRATLFMTLLAGFKALLFRLTHTADLTVGTPIANRRHQETESLIGFFANTLALRTRLKDSWTFSELVEGVRQVTLQAYAHQDLPFERLVEELQPERDLAHAPIFQIMFILQTAPLPDVALPELELHPVSVDSATSKFDLTLSVQHRNGELTGWIEYAVDLFGPTTVERLARQWGRLLRSALAEPQKPIREWTLLSAAEVHQLRDENNDSENIVSCQQPLLHQLFEAQAAATPDRVALVFDGLSTELADTDIVALTFDSLNRRANRLAHTLRRDGVGPDVPVAICLERSVAMIVAVLGVLKAGGALVPIDPAYPADRRAYMFEDSGARVLLGDPTRLAALERPNAPHDPVRSIALDTASSPLNSKGLEDNLDVLAEPANTFYIIYTSGSTGRPKGIELPHLALDNLLAWHRDQLLVGRRTLQFAPLGFDASFHEMFAAWASGGSLHLIAEEARRDVPLLTRYLEAWRIEKIIVPVVVLHQLAECFHQGLRPGQSLREITTTGEQLQVTPAVVRWFADLELPLHNHYGPSETHVVTAETLSGNPTDWPSHPTIGRPIDNCRIHVLDSLQRHVPAHVTGELFIGGPCLARGYLGRAAQTAEKFVPDPHGAPGDRLYRTGDLARWQTDGRLEFLGRADHQLKIRGFRIEPEEIEAALLEQPGVLEAVVIPRDDLPGGRGLVAYLVSDPEASTSTTALRGALLATLPAYMVPSRLVPVDALPLTPNGKIDRRALGRRPLPQTGEVDEASVSAPRTLYEIWTAEIWSELLDSGPLGTDSHFFHLGGHSLLATQVIARVRAATGIELPLRAVFEAPTLAAFARRLQVALGRERPAGAPPLMPRPDSTAAAPLSYAQQRLWILDQMSPGLNAYNVPHAVHIRGPLDIAAMGAAFDAIQLRHDVLRTRFQLHQGQPVQEVAPHTVWGLRQVDLRAVGQPAVDEALRLATREACRPFNLRTGPLVRALIVRLTAEEHLLILILHHIACDGWSLGVLFEELAASYRAFRQGTASPLPTLPVQYADYASWQRRWLHGEVLTTKTDYWRQLLADVPLLDLPTDRSRDRTLAFAGSARPFLFSAETTRRLSAFSQQRGVTLFMTLLGVFGTLLHRYSGQRDLIVGTPIANRDLVETEGLIGFFVNMLALHLEIDPRWTREALVDGVRDSTLTAYTHQDLPFETLVDALQPDRQLGGEPLVRVYFALQNTPKPSLELGDLSLDEWPLNNGTAKFDLTISLEPGPKGLAAVVEYNRGLFDDTTIGRLLRHFEALLEAFADDHGGPLIDLPMLGLAEQHQLVGEWNDRARPFPAERSLFALFTEQVRLRPHAIALASDRTELSYGFLERSARGLASRLRDLGAGPESLIATWQERSPEWILSILGILAAGGAYLPLSQAFPPARLQNILDEAKVDALLTTPTSGSSTHSTRPTGEFPVLEVESCWGAPPVETPLPTIDSRQLAYVIYTSGSTGRPKGVTIEQRSVSRLVLGTDYVQLGPEDCLAQLSDTSFDAATFEIWGALLRGGRLNILEPSTVLSPTLLAEALARRRITTAFVTTALFNTLVRHRPALFATCEQILFGGEAVDPESVRACLAAGGPKRLLHVYGPTESTTYASWHPVTEVPAGATTLPIGRPLANTEIRILDRSLRPVPVGIGGELTLSGPGLARGYLRRPSRTAQVFAPNPQARRPGDRLYRTGDRVRWLADGTVEFLGRLDHQVKVRGFRIELGEIESALRPLPDVVECVVLARKSPEGRSLVAYVVGEAFRADAARDQLRQVLPEYMIPAFFVPLPALPMTTSGKIDRRALPEPERAFIHSEHVAPSTGLETTIAEIWSRVLGLDKVGRLDNFFELGGNSLLLIQVVEDMRRTLDRDIPMSLLFEHSNIAALVRALESSDATTPEPTDDPSMEASRARGARRRQRPTRRAPRRRPKTND